MTARDFLSCECCGEQVSQSEKLCPFCGSIVETKAWDEDESQVARQQQRVMWLKRTPFLAFLMAIMCFLIFAALAVLLFVVLLPLVWTMGRSVATFRQMAQHARRDSMSELWPIFGGLLAMLVLMFGAKRLWKRK